MTADPRHPSAPRFDHPSWLALAVAAAVLIPRTALVSRAHSEYWDDQPHLAQGLAFFLRTHIRVFRNDPPLGQALMALPMLAAGCVPESPDRYHARLAALAVTDPAAAEARRGLDPPYTAVLYDQPLRPETISLLVAVWKAILFLPGAMLVFHWCRRLYGLRSAWLGLALVLVEPTVAGHVAPAAPDLLGAQGILFACYFAWRHFASPSRRRLVAAGVATAAALLTKHTAAILPFVVTAYALAWHVRARRRRSPVDAAIPATTRGLLNQLFAVGIVTAGSIWALTGFDVSPPARHGPVVRAVYSETFSFRADLVNGALMRPWPAGYYIGSLRTAQDHAGEGHPAYLLGRHSTHGWWYYFPVVATYKVPLGVAAVLLLGLASLRRVPPAWDELPLALAALAWTLFLCLQQMNIGWRHFLPAYLPMLVLATRCLAPGRPSASPPRRSVVPSLAWVCVAAAAIHVHAYHPDYLSYVNLPRRDAHLAISDSNIDWGQALKQARAWLEANPPPPGRTVWLDYFGNLERRSAGYYLGDRVRQVDRGRGADAPRDGLLIVSPVYLVGLYDKTDRYRWLRDAERTHPAAKPVAVIGHCLRVYDLDRLRAAGVTPPSGP